MNLREAKQPVKTLGKYKEQQLIPRSESDFIIFHDESKKVEFVSPCIFMHNIISL